MARRPDRRPVIARRSDNLKRRLADPIPDVGDLEAFASRIIYEPSAKHKLSPRSFGLDPAPATSEDASYCDGHAGFTPADIGRIRSLMRLGIMAGLMGEATLSEDPRIIWAVDATGWVYEARVTNTGQTSFHGYPLLPGDAMATKVVRRFERWVYDSDDKSLYTLDKLTRERATATVRAAQERYRV